MKKKEHTATQSNPNMPKTPGNILLRVMAHSTDISKKAKKTPWPKPRCTAELSSEARLRLISAILAKGVMRLIEAKNQTIYKEVENVKEQKKHRKTKRAA